MKNLGILLIIALIAWAVLKSKQEQAGQITPGWEEDESYRDMPIEIVREIPVYNTIEEWEATHG